MFISRIKGELKPSRLNAEYYSPKYIEDEHTLKKLKMHPLDGIRERNSKITYGILKPDNTGNEFRVAKAEKFDGMFIDFNDCEPVSEELFAEYFRSEVKQGDVLIAIGGYVGRPAVVGKIPEGCRLNINRHLARIRVNESCIDPYFLVSYLSCDFGNRQLIREITGSVQAGINLEDLRLIGAPSFYVGTQTYIGNNVRKAELLREWALQVQVEAGGALPNYFGDIKSNGKKNYTVDESYLDTQRLDSEFYNPRYITLESVLKGDGGSRLGTLAKKVKGTWDKTRFSCFLYFEIGGLNISNGQITPEIVATEAAPSRAKTLILEGDILVSTVRPNRKNIGFVAEGDEEKEMVATSGFSVLRFGDVETAAFYHAWLRSDDATAQLMRWNSGSAYPAIDDDVPLNILVPSFDGDFKTFWGRKLVKAQYAFSAVKKLLQTSKILTEALIGGQITEAELIAAQEALEEGDTSKDRVILSKLTDKGYLAEGSKALFPDLDKLYELLDEAQLAKDAEAEQGTTE